MARLPLSPSKLASALLLLITFACLAPPAHAGSDGPATARWLREAGFALGYGTGTTKEGRYDFVSVLPVIGLDLGEVFGLIGARPPGTLEVIFEPMVSVTRKPGVDIEAGLGLLFKYGCRFGRLMPFIEGGAGVVSMNNLVREQAGGCNFIPQVGPGLHLFLTPNWALTTAYRFRHLSDCGLDRHNHGINSNLFVLGASFIYAPRQPAKSTHTTE